MKRALTGSQTVGPYYAIGLESLCGATVPSSEGVAETVGGRLLDANGVGIPDGFLELWQADSNGIYNSAPAGSPQAAIGFGRIQTGADGSFRFDTVRPGAVPYNAESYQAPHIVVLVYMRGLLRNLYTRMYFPGELSNQTDPILQLVPQERRSTLIARRDPSGVLHWDIVMRDQPATAMEETVFFAW